MNTDDTIVIPTEIEDNLKGLIEEAKNINQAGKSASTETDAQLSDIEGHIDNSIAHINTLSTQLDEAEKEAGDQLDELILEQSEEDAADEE